MLDFEEFASPEWGLLSQVSRPSRYAGSEWRPYTKIDWETSALKICCAIPSVSIEGVNEYAGF